MVVGGREIGAGPTFAPVRDCALDDVCECRFDLYAWYGILEADSDMAAG